MASSTPLSTVTRFGVSQSMPLCVIKLCRGEIAIVRHEGRYDLVTTAIATRIRERDECAFITSGVSRESSHSDEAYQGFSVPDELGSGDCPSGSATQAALREGRVDEARKLASSRPHKGYQMTIFSRRRGRSRELLEPGRDPLAECKTEEYAWAIHSTARMR